MVQGVQPWPRVLLFALPLLFLMAAVGLSHLARATPWPRAGQLLAFLAILAVGTGSVRNIWRDESIRLSEEGGACRPAQTIIADLASQLGSRVHIMAGVPCFPMLVYYGQRRGLNSLSYGPPQVGEDHGRRVIVVIHKRWSTLKALLGIQMRPDLYTPDAWTKIANYPEVTVHSRTLP